jgi:methylmalonyl-CoA/ethylmalonyl-CoA epimerase
VESGSAMKFDHLGLVVKRLRTGSTHLTAIINIRLRTDEFTDSVKGVRCQFGRSDSGICCELLELLGAESPVAAALTCLVHDLGVKAERLTEAGCAKSGAPKSAIAYGGRLIQFFVTPLDFIAEWIEAPGHCHRFAYPPVGQLHGGSR